MRRTTAAALLCLTASACLTAPPRAKFPTADFVVPRSVRVQLVENGSLVLRDVPLEDYVRATILSEFAPAEGDPVSVERMLEVQAVISRTYAVSHVGRHTRDGFDLCSATHCQLFDPARLQTSRWAGAATTAAARTEGVVLRFAGAPAQALFHADCGGRMSTASAVWGGDDRAYLPTHDDSGVPVETHARWEYRVAIEALTKALDADDRSRALGDVERVAIVRRDEAGRAQEVSIERSTGRGSNRGAVRTELRGDELRQILSRAFGARTIRSTWFDVRRDGRSFVFNGRGFGHGVGLCQAGALARIREGASLEEIVGFYYPGTSLAAAVSTLSSSSHRPRY